jgi:hypothetical protein
VTKAFATDLSNYSKKLALCERILQEKRTLLLQRSRPNGPRIFLLLAVRTFPLPVQRLPQPEPRPRLPVRVASHAAEPVKAARAVKGVG